ncbi:MAG: ABC transporter ATP-binding protein [Verrucomicrobiota bacterium]
MIELNNISKDYQDADRPGGILTVLQEISLQIDAGDSVAIVGESGSGKSTLLNLIGALDKPSGGELIWQGKSLAEKSEKELGQFRNKEVGFIFQMHHLLPHCSALENILVPTLLNKSSLDVKTRAEELLIKFGLKDRMNHLPGKLSGGERQRVAVARALINQPSLILADEPTGALDQGNAEKLIDLLVDLNEREKQTLVMVTHADVYARRMKRCLRLVHGRLQDK